MKDKNQIRGVIAEIIEKGNQKSAFEVFLNTEFIHPQSLTEKSVVGEERSVIYKQLIAAKNEYETLVSKNMGLFNEMARLETFISQARCLISTEVKLTLVNQKRGGSETSYVVARSNFYNPELIKSEIRVYLGKSEDLGTDLIKLAMDNKFMDNAERLIVLAMKEVMVKQGALVSIKKSAYVKVAVGAEGEIEEVLSQPKKVNQIRSPYNPGPGSNPKPKHYGLLETKKKKG